MEVMNSDKSLLLPTATAATTTTWFAFKCIFVPDKSTFKIVLLIATIGLFALLGIVRVQKFVYRPINPRYGSGGGSETVHAVSNYFISAVSQKKVFVASMFPGFNNSNSSIDKAIEEKGAAALSGQGCPPVLERASFGRWVPRAHTARERELVERFLNRTRTAHKLPLTLQRKDNRCGNLNMVEKGSPGGLSWYRALCNPWGPSSCCHSNHTCVSLTEAECRCKGCQDMRQQRHAELSTWVPHDATCQLQKFTGESDMCPLLKNFTIQLLGDSFMRQVFISLLGTLRSAYPDGVIKDSKLSRARVEQCDIYYRYFSKCHDVIPMAAEECGKTVRFYRNSLWRASQAGKIVKMFEKYVGKPNTFVVFGLGIHDMYHPEIIISKILKPVLQVLQRSPPWPHLIWVAPHAPGLLKTPKVIQQNYDAVFRYNAVVTPFLKSKGIPVLDGFNLTKDGMMSYDGTHYGKGINDVKAQVLLNYFKEIRPYL